MQLKYTSDGGWLPDTNGTFDVSDFGAKGDGVTDDAVAIQTALTARASVGGGPVLVPALGQLYKLGSPISIPSGVSLYCPGFAGVRTTVANPARGAGFFAATAMPVMISSDLDAEGIGVFGLSLDGRDLADTVLKVSGFQARIRDNEIKRGNLVGLNLVPGSATTSHEAWVKDNIVSQNARGTGILLTGISGARQAHDNQIVGNVVRGAVACGIDCDRSGGNLIAQNHVYDFPGNPTAMLMGIRVTGAGNVTIADNYLDNIAGGPSIRLVGSTDTTKKARNLLVKGNTFYTSGVMTDNTYNAIEVDDAGTANSIWGVSISSNEWNADDTGGNRWKTAVTIIGTVPGVSFMDADIYGAVAAWGATRPAYVRGVRRFTANFGAGLALSENSGVLSTAFDGVTQTYSMAHGLLGTPRSLVVSPSNGAARNLGIAFSVGANGANMNVAFQTIPGAAAGPFTYNWYAEM